MNIHMVSQNATNGDLVDVFYFGSRWTMTRWLEDHGVTYYSEIGRTDLADGTSYEYGAWPCGSETDYDVHDAYDGELLWRGLESQGEDQDAGNEAFSAAMRGVEGLCYYHHGGDQPCPDGSH